MARYLPILLGIVLIVGLTIPQIQMTARFEGSNITAEHFAELLKNVPKTIGDWEGEDLPVEEQVQKTAGAVGYVSRAYHNSRTNEDVTLWLIVGHFKSISGHTPDICYPSSGFKKRADHNSRHPLTFEGQPRADFWTNTFLQEDAHGRRLIRVFWSWYRPQKDGSIRWIAADHPRREFGNARALYKMYFTSVMGGPQETTDLSPCMRFARDFMPVVEKALSEAVADEPGTSEG